MDPVRLSKLRKTSQATFAASSFSSWFIFVDKCNLMTESDVERQTPTLPQKCIKILSGCAVV